MRLDDNKIHIFGARRVNVTGLGARQPRTEELALPKSVETGNLGLNKAVIRWMSVELAVSSMIELAAKLAGQNRNLRAQRDLVLPKLVSGEIEIDAASASIQEAAE